MSRLRDTKERLGINNEFRLKKNILLENIQSTPFTGIGKPEPLRYTLSGFWSRRIDKVHRIIYKVSSNKIEIISVRFHYS